MENNKKVLLVASQPTVLRTLSRMAHEQSYSTEIAYNMAEAKSVLERESQVFAILLDYSQTDAPRGEAIYPILQYGVPTIVLTDEVSEEIRERILNEAVVDYVCKSSPSAFEYAMKLLERLARNPQIKVLIVDDSSSARTYLRQLLERHRYQVLEAGDGYEALDIVQREKGIRLILADNAMPRMDGIRLTSELRRLPRQRRLAIIGISAIQDSTLTARFLKAGADDYLQKPFNHEEFFCRVTRGIDFIENVRALELAAFTDPLTGLHNRRYFFDRTRRSHGEHQLAILDIDHFKRINDTYGHDAGDKVIVHVANMLRAHFPKEVVARLGGEEFVVLSTESSMLRFGKRLKLFQTELADSTVDSEQGAIRLTISIGAATQNEHMVLIEAMKQADSRLYRAKVEGRNRLCVD